MPVNKITHQRIEKANKILCELKKMVEQNNLEQEKYSNLTFEYCKYIPYVGKFILNNDDIIDTHISRMGTIQNIYDTYCSIIKNKRKQSIMSKPIDVYRALNMEIQSMDETSRAYHDLVNYITRDNNILKILRIYQVYSKKQNDVYEEYTKNITDKKLLFHGSPVANWFSILKNGFYIDPTKVGVKINGKVHGNGVYFSDKITFSLGYCNLGNTDTSGVAILGMCEVALCSKSVNKSPIFVIFDTNQYVFKYLVVVENK
eukprot:Pompholyxophrys_punicea_v1_NODE_922_length_1136_cov_2.574468.p1 type:complete len:259 gc:universal NODE_922_length_1136_cov_2.574468:949-173(-)